MTEQFLSDLYIDGCITQISTENKVIETIGKDLSSLDSLLTFWEDSNLYFVSGVDKSVEKHRASDNDIKLKNYIYIDLDVRKSYPDITDKGIKDIGYTVKDILINNNISYRYIVYTGNGIHVYMFTDKPFKITDKSYWKMGLLEQINKFESILDMKGLDRSCINPARLARLPGSHNVKGEKKLVEILDFNDSYSDVLPRLEEIGRQKAGAIMAENKKQAESIKVDVGESGTFDAICNLPIADVVSAATGWANNNGHFTEPGKPKEKACFVPEGQNFLVHGNTDHLPSDQIGFSTFTFVKAYFKLGNKETFKWFKDRYAIIADLSREELRKKRDGDRPAVPPSSTMSNDTPTIDSAFEELENVQFDQLPLGGEWDDHKFIIRGAVTRINAYSNIGKSKLTYYFVHKLLEHGSKGILFSTEVVRSIVLANLLIIPTGFEFWDIVKRRVALPEGIQDRYKNLAIYDVNHTQNKLAEIEKLIKESKDVDFVVIDFVQGVTPKYPAADEYSRMTHYALEVQRIAQENNIAIIDLSQISNSGVKDEGASSGFIPSKGSGHLVSSADIGILLKRNKNDPSDNTMKFDIRKHKYLPTKELLLECDFNKGRFELFGHDFV